MREVGIGTNGAFLCFKKQKVVFAVTLLSIENCTLLSICNDGILINPTLRHRLLNDQYVIVHLDNNIVSQKAGFGKRTPVFNSLKFLIEKFDEVVGRFGIVAVAYDARLGFLRRRRN